MIAECAYEIWWSVPPPCGLRNVISPSLPEGRGPVEFSKVPELTFSVLKYLLVSGSIFVVVVSK